MFCFRAEVARAVHIDVQETTTNVRLESPRKGRSCQTDSVNPGEPATCKPIPGTVNAIHGDATEELIFDCTSAGDTEFRLASRLCSNSKASGV
jgi:hypothetical protein